MEDYNSALSISPKDADSLYYRSLLLVKLGRIEDAKKDLEFLLEKMSGTKNNKDFLNSMNA